MIPELALLSIVAAADIRIRFVAVRRPYLLRFRTKAMIRRRVAVLLKIVGMLKEAHHQTGNIMIAGTGHTSASPKGASRHSPDGVCAVRLNELDASKPRETMARGLAWLNLASSSEHTSNRRHRSFASPACIGLCTHPVVSAHLKSIPRSGNSVDGLGRVPSHQPHANDISFLGVFTWITMKRASGISSLDMGTTLNPGPL